MVSKTLIVWLLKATIAWVPLSLFPYKETKAEYRDRRESIVLDILEATQDPAEKPLFKGPDARLKTAVFMAAIASEESAYDLNVDVGIRKGGIGEVCILQVVVNGKTAEGWTREEVIKDRKKCVRTSLHILQKSRDICSDAKSIYNKSHTALEGADQFGLYTSGSCYTGNLAAHRRFDKAMDWFKLNPAPTQP